MRCKGTEVEKTKKYKQSNIVAVPRALIRAQSKVVLCIDMFFVNKYVFITTYSNGICYTTTSHVSTGSEALLALSDASHTDVHSEGILYHYDTWRFRI